jgi:2-keto-4-pentenoate hydratase/2-oxohepta-3-ene-1,7-dioic acid hydratase in catechol pathway
MPLPIEVPGKIICVGLNYLEHAAEGGREAPPLPVLFAKWNNTLIGPGDPIVIPPAVEFCDYEGELGVIIGKRASRVAEENALDYVGAYCCVNDVSARDHQRAQPQWCYGKSPDTFCPVGQPVPASQIPDPQNLHLRTILNGQVMQDTNTSEMIFGVANLIAFITQLITLEPGDLIATGTSAGVGIARKPPVQMKQGDEVTIEISGLPSLTNPVTDEQ